MNLKRKFIAVAATFLTFSIVGVGQATADGIAVTVSSEEPFVDFSALSAGGGYQVNVAQGFGDPSVQFYSGSAPMDYYTRNNLVATPNLVNENDDFVSLSSQISGTVTSGNYTIRVSWCGWFCNSYPQTVPEENVVPTQTYTLTYTGLTNVTRVQSFYYRNRVASNSLKLITTPTLSQSGNSMSCSAGSYKFLNGGTTEQSPSLDSLVYTLVIDGKVASQVSAGSSSGIHSSLFGAGTHSVKGIADMTSATFDVSGLSDFSASCQIYAVQGNANLQSTSNVIDDSVKLRKAAAKAQAWEEQRATSTAANFTAEAREMRKRIAARAGNK